MDGVFVGSLVGDLDGAFVGSLIGDLVGDIVGVLVIGDEIGDDVPEPMSHYKKITINTGRIIEKIIEINVGHYQSYDFLHTI